MRMAGPCTLVVVRLSERMLALYFMHGASLGAKTHEIQVRHVFHKPHGYGCTQPTSRDHVGCACAHRGQSIIVRTSLTGHISNGWIT